MSRRTFGVTVALRAEHVDAALAAGRDNLNREVRELASRAAETLKAYVGGAPPRSELSVRLAGPEPDPIQGYLYGVSVAAIFDTDDLGVDCPARLLLLSEETPGAGAADVRPEQGV